MYIGAGSQETRMIWGFQMVEKKFQIGLAVLIQYRRVTDTQPPSQTRCRSKDIAYVARVKTVLFSFND